MSTVNTFRSDLNHLFNLYQNNISLFPKEVFVEQLRSFFAQDSYFHYVSDQWGFPKTPDLTDVNPDAGLSDDVTTRLYISEAYRSDIIFYPAIIVKGGSGRWVPISFNNNAGVVHYEVTRFVDGYGTESLISSPSYIATSGAWESTINLDIVANSNRARDELTDLVASFCMELRRIDLQTAGVFIKSVSKSGPTEVDDRNGKLYKDTISCEIRTEWHRHIPVSNIVDAIQICTNFGNLEVTPFDLAPNIRVSTAIELADVLLDS